MKKRNGLLNRISKKINNFFKPKPQIYLLSPGESLEISGNIPIRPATTVFNKINSILSHIVSKVINIIKPPKVNIPEIYSESPAIIHKPKKLPKHKTTPLLESKSFVPEKIITFTTK